MLDSLITVIVIRINTMSSKAKKLDRAYFTEHPATAIYVREPLEGEWPGLQLPDGAFVEVHAINYRCRVRVVQDGDGTRLAPPVMDVEPENKPYTNKAA